MLSQKSRPDPSAWESVKILFGASRAYWLVNMVNFGDGIAYFGILTLLTLYLGKERLGMSDYFAGLSVSAFTGLVTLFMFGGGFLSDRLGVRRALTFCLWLLLAGRVFLSAAPAFGQASHYAAWLGLLILSFGEGVIQPALYSGVKEYTDARTATMGYGILYAVMNLGQVAENFISPYVRTSAVFVGGVRGLGWGFEGVFWMCTAISAAMLLAHLVFFTRKTEEAGRATADAPEAPEAPKSWKEKMKELPFLDPRFMFFIFILYPVRTLFAHQFLTMPDYVFRAYPPEVAAKFEWINGLNPLIIVIFVPTIAALTRRVNIVTMMIIGTAISALTTFILAPGPDLTRLILYVVFFSFGEAVWSSRFLEYVANIAPKGKVGAYMGLACIPWFFAKFTTGLYSGAMLEHFVPKGGVQDTGTLWLIYAIFACVSPLGLILARRWLMRHQQEVRHA